MAGTIEDEGAVEALRLGSDLDDVEPPIAQVHRRAPGEAARPRRVEHLHLDAHVLRRACVTETDGLASFRARVPHEHGDDHDREQGAADRERALQRTRFHSSTVSGNSVWPSRTACSMRIRTTWRKTASKSLATCAARKARSARAKLRPGSRKSAMNRARPSRRHCALPTVCQRTA